MAKATKEAQETKAIRRYIKLTFIEPVLGTWPSNENVARDFIASKSPDANTIEDEVAAIGAEAVADKAMTVFPRVDGKPVFYDYQIKGFFKDTCSALARAKYTKSSGLKAFKKVIDGLIFPFPRAISINVNGEIGECQRALRAQTAQGERVSLANSEEIPAGSTIKFGVTLADPAHEALLKEWLDNGFFRGLGQWRNSGKGRFVYKMLDEEGNNLGGTAEKFGYMMQEANFFPEEKAG